VKSIYLTLFGLALVAGAMQGCGEAEASKPTADEAKTFVGKEITPEQRAKGMAAAMSHAGK